MVIYKSFITLLFLSLLSFSIEAQKVYLELYCPNTATFPSNGTYQTNLKHLLSSLSSNGTRGGNRFYSTTSGRDSDVVYGLFLCRGYVSNSSCERCVSAATDDINHLCPVGKIAVLWYDDCLIRYSNQSIFSTVATVPLFSSSTPVNITAPKQLFNQILAETMDNATTMAINATSGLKNFATREAIISAQETLYTLVQCTPDLSSSDCNTCLREAIAALPNCCSGKQGGRVLTPSCNLRYELFPFYNQLAAAAPPPLSVPTPPTPAAPGRKGMSSHTVIKIVVPTASFLVLSTLLCCVLRWKAKKKLGAQIMRNGESKARAMQSLRFDLSIIEGATDNFAEVNKIGAGGFGTVYKGTLPNGQEIAVKRLSTSSGQGAEEFQMEVLVVAKLQHRNLVKLLGYCLERDERMLIFEFMPNKSLDYFIFDPAKKGQLDWSKRYKIIKETARGLLYLHSDSRLKIIHRDLKAGNVLLDEDMTPKISDFGMAKIVGENLCPEATKRIVGTYGYMSPEYAMHGRFSEKSDVFSFGVLILEIVSGKKNTSFRHSEYPDNLLTYVWRHWKNGTPMELMDSILQDSYVSNEVRRCIQIGLLCVQEKPDARPTMARVVLMLSSPSVTLPSPQKTAFFFGTITGRKFSVVEQKSDQSTSTSCSATVNEVSFTEPFPR